MALARALVNQPKVLLLDEPLGALDLKLREQMQEELKALQKQLGITFVFVTHDQGEALSMADRVAVFNDGKIVQVGSPEDIYERPSVALRRRFRRLLQRAAAGFVSRHGGAASWASLRPEKIGVLPAGTTIGDGQARADGKITMISYLGAVDPLQRRRPAARGCSADDGRRRNRLAEARRAACD